MLETVAIEPSINNLTCNKITPNEAFKMILKHLKEMEYNIPDKLENHVNYQQVIDNK